MRSHTAKLFCLLLISLASVVGCRQRERGIVGKWQPIGVENRDSTMEFFTDGKARLDSSDLLDWKLVGRDLNITHPHASSKPIRVRVSFPDEDHLYFFVLDPETGKQASCRRFTRIVDDE
jgi:hypothetical protein